MPSGFDLPHQNTLSYKSSKQALILFSKIIALPGMHHLFKRTFLGTCVHVQRLTQQQRPEKAVLHLTKMLRRTDKDCRDDFKWWHLMRLAVTIAQDHQMSGHMVEQVDELTAMASEATPIQGYDCAYAFVGLGLWAFQKGDHDQAVHCIKTAVACDGEWGYPEYLLGWLGLFEPNIDAVTHFVNASKMNWSFFHRMTKDPICMQHPHIIKQVKSQMSSQVQSGPFASI